MKLRLLLASFLSALLSLLNYSCVEDEDEVEDVEYGTPHATFRLSGLVSDEFGNPLGGVLVRNNYSGDSLGWLSDTILTDSTGKYFYVNYECVRTTMDGDYIFSFVGDTNRFEPLDTLIPYENVKYKGGDGNWYKGAAEMTLNVTLKKK